MTRYFSPLSPECFDYCAENGRKQPGGAEMRYSAGGVVRAPGRLTPYATKPAVTGNLPSLRVLGALGGRTSRGLRVSTIRGECLTIICFPARSMPHPAGLRCGVRRCGPGGRLCGVVKGVFQQPWLAFLHCLCRPSQPSVNSGICKPLEPCRLLVCQPYSSATKQRSRRIFRESKPCKGSC